MNVCYLIYITFLEAKQDWAMPWLRQLDSGLSPLKPMFSPRPADNEYVVDRVALWQIFLRALLSDPVIIIRPMLYMHPVCTINAVLLKSTRKEEKKIE
jgi:hypothetical protein